MHVHLPAAIGDEESSTCLAQVPQRAIALLNHRAKKMIALGFDWVVLEDTWWWLQWILSQQVCNQVEMEVD